MQSKDYTGSVGLTYHGTAITEAAAALLASLPENDALADYGAALSRVVRKDAGKATAEGRPQEDWEGASLAAMRLYAAAVLLEQVPDDAELAGWAQAKAASILDHLEHLGHLERPLIESEEA
ncbi:MAG TPA: hypothetical protein VFE20_06585 [Thermoleophilia bacterium]|nr:hypothetical protein [Thermoleophilia bacterium]